MFARLSAVSAWFAENCSAEHILGWRASASCVELVETALPTRDQYNHAEGTWAVVAAVGPGTARDDSPSWAPYTENAVRDVAVVVDPAAVDRAVRRWWEGNHDALHAPWDAAAAAGLLAQARAGTGPAAQVLLVYAGARSRASTSDLPAQA